MAEEIQEAVQILRVAFEGIELSMKVGSGGLGAAKTMASFFAGMIHHEKLQGKTSMKELLSRGGDLQVIQINAKDAEKFKKIAKKYGVLYSVLPDIDGNGKLTEIIFHSEATPRVNLIKDKLGFGKISSLESFLKEGDKDKLDKFVNYLEKEKKGNDLVHAADNAKANIAMDSLIEKVGMYASAKQSVSVDDIKSNFNIDNAKAEKILGHLENIGLLGRKNDAGVHKVMMDEEAFKNRLKGYQELADRMKRIEISHNMDLSDITISKKLIISENDHAVKTRVPRTWGENARYIWINKENILDIHNGKTMLTFIDTNKNYKLYDESNKVVDTIKGDKLYTEHYDKVETSVREKVEKTANREKTITTTTKKTTTQSVTRKR